MVAVSKTKPLSAVLEAYAVGQRDFGENYVQEIVEKAPRAPQDVRWHFIGHLQSNKVKALLSAVPNLAVVETVDSEKLAKKLDRARAELLSQRKADEDGQALRGPGTSGAEGAEKSPASPTASSSPLLSPSSSAPLAVFLQVNTSGEASKSGVEPGEVAALAAAVRDSCPHLRVAGLMTIGMPDYTSRPENFACLRACRKDVAETLGVPEESLELSMGMSGDFEAAIEMGATNVRVGSTIFGARDYSK